MHEEVHWKGSDAQMHGSAITSIVVGKSVGVAPSADIYHIENP